MLLLTMAHMAGYLMPDGALEVLSPPWQLLAWGFLPVSYLLTALDSVDLPIFSSFLVRIFLGCFYYWLLEL